MSIEEESETNFGNLFNQMGSARMSTAEKIKGIGMGIGLLAIGVAVMVITVTLVFGMIRVVSPWLNSAFFITQAVSLLVFGSTALFRRTRGFSAVGLFISSYIFGIILWIWSIILTLELWGVFAVIIGLLFVGVGIVPVAILALIFHAQWSSLGDIAIMLVSTYGARVLALWLANKADRDKTKADFDKTKDSILNDEKFAQFLASKADRDEKCQ